MFQSFRQISFNYRADVSAVRSNTSCQPGEAATTESERKTNHDQPPQQRPRHRPRHPRRPDRCRTRRRIRRRPRQTIFSSALTTAGVLTTVAGVAGRGTNMIVDGIAISRLPEPLKAQKARPRRSETGRDCAKSSGPLSSWESRLRERLAMVGSTECALIWREKTSPAGSSISRCAPWTPPTSVSGSGGAPWPTPEAGAFGAANQERILERRAELEEVREQPVQSDDQAGGSLVAMADANGSGRSGRQEASERGVFRGTVETGCWRIGLRQRACQAARRPATRPATAAA